MCYPVWWPGANLHAPRESVKMLEGEAKAGM